MLSEDIASIAEEATKIIDEAPKNIPLSRNLAGEMGKSLKKVGLLMKELVEKVEKQADLEVNLENLEAGCDDLRAELEDVTDAVVALVQELLDRKPDADLRPALENLLSKIKDAGPSPRKLKSIIP